ncbi:MAG: beta-lactamase family protein [Acidobacteriota bacterium]|nr:beta-lactamase family protein [Acidobacteriota bacterium]
MNVSLFPALAFASLIWPLFSSTPAQSVSAPQAPVSPADGIWLGALHPTPAMQLRIQLHLKLGSAGTCALDSLDQGANAIPCNNLQLSGQMLTFDVPAVQGKFTGTLSDDGKTITGAWTQGSPLPLVLERQAAALAVPKPPTPPSDAAMPPVAVADLKPVLDADLALSLKNGPLAPEKHGGVTIGVVQHGIRSIFSYGTAKPDSVFEIGSISKTFTGLILAQMVQQGEVHLDDPVRVLLPPDTVAKPTTGDEITLLDISDQHAALPRMPDNFHPADKSNPYADYDAKALYAFIAKHGVAHPADAPFLYSNLAVGLLGQALANRAGVPYPALLHDQVTGPLKMTDTSIPLTPVTQSRLIQGYDGNAKPAHAWDLDALAGAGGIRSTAADMLVYLDAQLHPDRLPAGALATPHGKTLPAAIAQSHILRAEAGGGMHIALNWFRVDATGSYWHNGGTGGYSSYALFNPDQDYAIVVLFNTSPDVPFADLLGAHIEQRLTGQPALKLAREFPEIVDINPKVLDGYTGQYQLAPNFILTVARDGTHMTTQATDQGKIEIFPESQTKFFTKAMEADITFVTDDQGRATSIILHQNGADHPAPRVK